jgi:hypothetical protein
LKITGPDRYRLRFNNARFEISSSEGNPYFSGRAAARGLPKLYVVVMEGKPVYVGITTQPMQSRLRYGWKAAGEAGYWGYSWRRRRSLADAGLDIWYHEDASKAAGQVSKQVDIETVEAEVVHLIRCAGQWPSGQTEIHFHRSRRTHRAAAAAIMRTYKTAKRLTRRKCSGFSREVH